MGRSRGEMMDGVAQEFEWVEEASMAVEEGAELVVAAYWS